MIQIILCKDANLNCVINVRISLGCNFRWTCTNIKKHIQKYLINQSKTPLNNVWFNNMKRRRVISIMEMGRKGRREETFEMTYITNFVVGVSGTSLGERLLSRMIRCYIRFQKKTPKIVKFLFKFKALPSALNVVLGLTPIFYKENINKNPGHLLRVLLRAHLIHVIH